MKQLIVITLLLGIIITTLFMAANPTVQVTNKMDKPDEASTPLLIAQPQRQRQRLVVSAGLGEAQQTQYKVAMAKFGKLRKQLLQQRKFVSRAFYKSQLELIKVEHERELASIMGPEQYQLFSNKMTAKRLARVQQHTRHKQEHQHEGRFARRLRQNVLK